jgi:hypothetical protein
MNEMMSPPERARLEAKLEELVIDNRDFERVEREFDQFCPFEALGMVRAEIRHGAFLANFLDPHRPHGFGSRVLRALLMTAARAGRVHGVGNDSSLSPLGVHLLHLDEAEVRREWRHIDLLIVLHDQKIVVAIELKIDSSQHSDQLRRYRMAVQDEWPAEEWRHVRIFLTKVNEKPDDQGFWIPVRLRQFIDELEPLAKHGGGDPAAVMMLGAYLKMMRRHHLANADLRAAARRLWLEHREALEYLMNNRSDALAEAFATLNESAFEFAKGLPHDRGAFVFDSSTPTITRFAFAPWDAVPGFLTGVNWTSSGRLILFEIKRDGDSVAGFVYLGPGSTADRPRLAEMLKDKRLHRPTGHVGPDYMCLARSTLADFRGVEGIDAILKGIKDKFPQFLTKMLDHFDPILRPAIGTESVAKGAVDEG